MVKLKHNGMVIKMINFIICEDEETLSKKYKVEIEKFMMKYDIDYKFYTFKGYTEKWIEYVSKSDGFKVYLLDIKTEKGSGLDAARMIREEFDDWVSMIIIISSYSEYRYDALGKRLMLVDFINKLDNCEDRLKQALSICIKNYDNKLKALRYTYKNVAYNIDLKHILWIEREPDSKKCTIKTTYGEFQIQGTLKTIMKNLDKRFVKSCRGTVINIDQVLSFDAKASTIKFKDGNETKSVSREKKKEIMNYVRGIN